MLSLSRSLSRRLDGLQRRLLQECERRAVRAVEKMPDVETSLKFEEFVRATLKAGKLAEKYAAVCAEVDGEAKPAE